MYYNRRALRALVYRNWFLVGVLMAILFAQLRPTIGASGGILMPEWTAKYLSVGVIFFISGLSLRLDDLTGTIASYKLHVFVQVFTFGLIPIVMVVLCSLVFAHLGVDQWILKGMITVSCMPPPVSSAIVLTKAVGGNEAAAVFNSVLGSFLGVIISPFSLLLFLGSSAMLSMVDSIVALSQTVIIPLVVGLALRHFNIITRHRSVPLSEVGQAVLLFIIYTTFCDAFLTHDSPMNALDVLFCVLLVTLLQLAFLFTSFHLAKNMELFTAADIVAITFCSTHKSLTLGIPILRILYSGYSHFSQITLPLLVYHPTQILLGSLLVAPFKKWLYHHTARIKFRP
ncbi:solute carrier family 10 (sodium bile acid cotransporter family), member 7 [Nesidiocoris tenuis]|uniref:Solute carrier family 10 (Sodium bile acid cotransporter family), member 7 n=1 Tax=Nesidiocoris tenuis TaxID=355587 RepID=A0ABN7AQM1_9HEMI|nr:solute carrier family 10 (sodium bile acid cotransporter family), member 7 [Nesidiocoris tenuis]